MTTAASQQRFDVMQLIGRTLVVVGEAHAEWQAEYASMAPSGILKSRPWSTARVDHIMRHSGEYGT
jgi:hypothetical protein